MKRLMPLLLIISFLLSACGASSSAKNATPTISVEDIYATANAINYDILTKTQAAMPTNTLVPPTVPPPPATIAPVTVPTFGGVTATSLALATVAPPLVGGTATATRMATATSPVVITSCMDKQLVSWTGDSARLSVSNNVKDTTANVFLCITTEFDEIGFISIPVLMSNSASVPLGCYSATAWVTGKSDFNDTVAFCISRTDNVQLIIDEGHLRCGNGCSPNN